MRRIKFSVYGIVAALSSTGTRHTAISATDSRAIRQFTGSPRTDSFRARSRLHSTCNIYCKICHATETLRDKYYYYTLSGEKGSTRYFRRRSLEDRKTGMASAILLGTLSYPILYQRQARDSRTRNGKYPT